jgi:hypothetical protein
LIVAPARPMTRPSHPAHSIVSSASGLTRAGGPRAPRLSSRRRRRGEREREREREYERERRRRRRRGDLDHDLDRDRRRPERDRERLDHERERERERDLSRLTPPRGGERERERDRPRPRGGDLPSSSFTRASAIARVAVAEVGGHSTTRRAGTARSSRRVGSKSVVAIPVDARDARGDARRPPAR